MIEYGYTLDAVTEKELVGFFEDWPSPPSPRTHLRLLRQSAAVVLAVDVPSGRVIGFVSAISDGVISAYIPLLEVLPSYRGHGIGSELVRRILRRLQHLYMIDLVCEPELEPYYERFGMMKRSGMIVRNYASQSRVEATDGPPSSPAKP